VFAPASAVAAGVFVTIAAADIPLSVEKQVLGFRAAIKHKLLLGLIILIKTLKSIQFCAARELCFTLCCSGISIFGSKLGQL
jgi:hypothetical protein